MEALWADLSRRKALGKLDQGEEKAFKRLVKTLGYLGADPRHNSLASHEISDLSRMYGIRIFQSYLEEQNAGSRADFLGLRAGEREITVLAIEPHPEDTKRGGYARVRLSALPTKARTGK